MPWSVYIEFCELLQSSCSLDGLVRERIRFYVYIALRWLAGASNVIMATSKRLPITNLYGRMDPLICGLDLPPPLIFLHDEDDTLQENAVLDS